MKIAIVMPVVLQNEVLRQMTLDAVRHLVTQHEATLYVVTNRLHVCTPDALQADLTANFPGRARLLHEAGVERGVAGAWNHGCQIALQEGASYLTIVANDTRLRPECLDRLVEYGETGAADLWSGLAENGRDQIDVSRATDGADFSCFMMRPATLQKHGLFDANYRPAYFEDNDYYGRVVLGGGKCRVVHGAQFFHHGSMTVRSDPEMAHHVRHWFEKNREYFRKKWGVANPENSAEGVLQRYFPHPFNDVSRPLTWFPT
jgi:GT2 family glycosyltransferase